MSEIVSRVSLPGPSRPRLHLSPTTRRWVLTVHITAGVGLLGEVAGFLAVAIRGSAADPEFAHTCWQLLQMFAFAFGIPLSLGTLASGLVLARSTKWGVFRHWWVTLKFALIVSVILVGALVHGPGIEALIDGGGSETRTIAFAAYQVAALATATGLSVFKPGGRLRRR